MVNRSFWLVLLIFLLGVPLMAKDTLSFCFFPKPVPLLSQPSLSAPTVSTLNFGTGVYVLSKKGAWTQVKTNEGTGFVLSDYLLPWPPKVSSETFDLYFQFLESLGYPTEGVHLAPRSTGLYRELFQYSLPKLSFNQALLLLGNLENIDPDLVVKTWDWVRSAQTSSTLYLNSKAPMINPKRQSLEVRFDPQGHPRMLIYYLRNEGLSKMTYVHTQANGTLGLNIETVIDQ
ncbi:MAG: SH3 domain-containing protein [Candidatus Margulisiibacteriota bacterium]